MTQVCPALSFLRCKTIFSPEERGELPGTFCIPLASLISPDTGMPSTHLHCSDITRLMSFGVLCTPSRLGAIPGAHHRPPCPPCEVLEALAPVPVPFSLFTCHPLWHPWPGPACRFRSSSSMGPSRVRDMTAVARPTGKMIDPPPSDSASSRPSLFRRKAWCSSLTAEAHAGLSWSTTEAWVAFRLPLYLPFMFQRGSYPGGAARQLPGSSSRRYAVLRRWVPPSILVDTVDQMPPNRPSLESSAADFVALSAHLLRPSYF